MKNLNHVVSLIQQNYTTIRVSFDNTQRLPEKQQPVTINVQEVDGYLWDGDATPARGQPQRAKPRTYTYKCPIELARTLTQGMLVIVPESAHKGVQIGTVVAIDEEPNIDFDSGITYKWIIGAVDTTQYDRIISQEQEMVRLLRESEKAKARQALLDAYHLSLPEGSEARKLFDQAAQLGKPQSE